MIEILIGLFLAPGVLVGRLLWRTFSRPQRSSRYLMIVLMTTLAGFFAVEFLMLFALGSWMNSECPYFGECHPRISKDNQTTFLVLSCLCAGLVYGGLKYRKQ